MMAVELYFLDGYTDTGFFGSITIAWHQSVYEPVEEDSPQIETQKNSLLLCITQAVFSHHYYQCVII